jgi:hypothetical protein
MVGGLATHLAFATVALATMAGRLQCTDWINVTPRIKSQVHTLSRVEAETLLSRACKSAVRSDDFIGLTCSTRQFGHVFADIVDHSFHPKGVVYGHFIAPDTDDAAVSGSSNEGHPDLGGGTLLLTRRNGRWTPLWYKSTVITDSCLKTSMPSGRDILLCETEDGGMGYVDHYLYAVDLTRPADIRDAPLVTAISCEVGCTIHRQEIRRVQWEQDTRRLSVTVRTPEWRRTCDDGYPRQKRPPLVSALEFELTDSGFSASIGPAPMK